MPEEIGTSIRFTRSSPSEAVIQFSDDQLGRVADLISAAAPTQAELDSFIPDRIRSAAGFIKTVAPTELMRQFGTKGGICLQQFIFGFDIAGSFSQRNVFPICSKANAPAPIDVVLEGVEESFSSMPRSSPSAHAGYLRPDALTQVTAGWLEPPRRLTPQVCLRVIRLRRSTLYFAFRLYIRIRLAHVAISNTD